MPCMQAEDPQGDAPTLMTDVWIPERPLLRRALGAAFSPAFEVRARGREIIITHRLLRAYADVCEGPVMREPYARVLPGIRSLPRVLGVFS
jgi:hypothetical protein